ncbi:hypothetical protein [Mesobacillus subterraneus]|uniref:Uncharacterized protein n=1 Tax=Mesobacillus subterraneus TaxID=285983 RepID=A0A3R9E909_9BACI|nr:hypothetical protein [Mesobacillus subterraneus]RSD28708.1 hypothetical protein EJA10_03800 [Mesobacillus subterraneus]
MYLLLSIILSIVLGYFLLIMGPLAGGVIAFGIIAGCLFRGVFLLNSLHKKLSRLMLGKGEQIQKEQVLEHLPEHLTSAMA